MKHSSKKMNRHFIATSIFTTIVVSALFSSCKKNDSPSNNQVSQYSSDVVDKWMGMQLRLIKNTTGVPNQAFGRHYAYAGITALESIVPGLHGNMLTHRKWNGLTGLPTPEHLARYYYPANVNAGLAAINRAMFPNASAADKAAIDSLESALYQSFSGEQSDVLARSVAFGKAVAAAVFNWAETDGSKTVYPAWVLPTGPGKWKPTPPANAAPASPYWGNNRTVITGSIDNTAPPAPTAYSEDPGSDFYKMVKNVYESANAATDDQKAAVLFWKDVPGATSPGHWISITQQVIRQKAARLDKAVFAYAMTGSALNDAAISCWKYKYIHNLVRPITYIREVMGYANWNTHIPTPAHPEYTSGHSVLAAATANTLQRIFGNIGTFTDHTYDYMGFAPRTYNSFVDIAKEGGQSRVWGGIHYQESVDLGLIQGKKVFDNIFSNVHASF